MNNLQDGRSVISTALTLFSPLAVSTLLKFGLPLFLASVN